MKCKYLKQKLNRTIYCKKKNKIITIGECNGCKFREYKEQIIKKTNNKPSKRTKSLSIPKDVKLEVWERDNHRCIFCGKLVPWNCANSHFIKRSHGGLGIPENIMTNCPDCHTLFDNSKHRESMLPIAEVYLKSKYKEWNYDILIYKK